MNTARIVVLANSVAAGGLAIHIPTSPDSKPVIAVSAVQTITADAPAAASDIQRGASRPFRLFATRGTAAPTRETTR